MRWAISIFLVLAVPACSSGGDDKKATDREPVEATTTTTAPRPTTTTTIPLYSFDNSVPPPKLHNTGTDYEAIILSLTEYGNWLAAHNPDFALIEHLSAPGSRSEAGTRELVSILTEHGRRLYETYNGPSRVEIVSESDDLVTARLRQNIKEQVVVDRNGTVLSRRNRGVLTYNVLIAKLPDDTWVLASLSEDKSSVKQ